MSVSPRGGLNCQTTASGADVDDDGSGSIALRSGMCRGQRLELLVYGEEVGDVVEQVVGDLGNFDDRDEFHDNPS